MTYTHKEAGYFYWHCTTAALILSTIELNTATRVHVANAVRMATLNAAGKRGIRYASKTAFEKYRTEGMDWTRLGLIREHVFPISTILSLIVEVHTEDRIHSWRELVPYLKDEDLVAWNVVESDAMHDARAPLSAVIAALVRRFTVLAWITGAEDDMLKDKGLTKSMPPGYGDDLLARYRACGIDMVDLQTLAG